MKIFEHVSALKFLSAKNYHVGMLFEFQILFIIGNFLKVIPYRENWIKRYFFQFHLKSNFPFLKSEVAHFFATFSILLFSSEVCLYF